MLIKWKIETREVPEVGFIYKGEIREVPDNIGKALVKQGQAKKVKTKSVDKG